MCAEEYILPHTRKRLIIYGTLKEDLIIKFLNKSFFVSNRDISGRTLIASNYYGHPPKILFFKKNEFAKYISANKPYQGLFQSMVGFFEKVIKCLKQSKIRENKSKMEKKLPEKCFFHILKKNLFGCDYRNQKGLKQALYTDICLHLSCKTCIHQVRYS